MAAKVHQEIHRKLELVNSHVELQNSVDPSAIGPVVFGRGGVRIDCANAELSQNPHAYTGAAVYCTLHQRHEHELRYKEGECRRCHPSVEVDDVGEHREQNPGLKQRFGDTAADKSTDRFDFSDDHRRSHPAGLRAGCGDPSDPQISEDMPTQIPYSVFSNPGAIDIE